jgi:hypothetical protein
VAEAKATTNFDARAIVDAVVRGVDLGLQRLVLEVQNDIKRSISGEGTGVRYSGSLRRSSRPGEPPAKQRGHLSRSWQAAKPARATAGRRIAWRVGSNVKYARILEFGSARIAQRPYVRPALVRASERADRVMTAYVRDEIRRLRLPQPKKA